MQVLARDTSRFGHSTDLERVTCIFQIGLGEAYFPLYGNIGPTIIPKSYMHLLIRITEYKKDYSQQPSIMSLINSFLSFFLRPLTLQRVIDQGRFAELSDTKAVQLFERAFHEELTGLKDADETVESGVTEPPGSLENGDTPSRFLYEKDYTEVNRTLVNMLALKWILAGEYDAFTDNQNQEARLTTQSFNDLRRFFKERLQSSHDIYALLVAVVLDDLGKSRGLTDSVKGSKSRKLENHSDILTEAVRSGEISLLKTVPDSVSEIIMGSIYVEGELNISQLVQAENVPASLAVIKRSNICQQVLEMRIMVTLLDVAGAAAHSNAKGCLVMTEFVYQGYMAAIHALNAFVSGDISSERECYDQVLSSRAKSLASKGYRLLVTTKAEERAFLRLLCIGRVDNPGQADIFKRAFDSLAKMQKDTLINGLNVDGLDDYPAILPYYAPGLVAEVLRGVGGKEDSVVIEALSTFMRFLSRVFEGPDRCPEPSRNVIECDLAFIQDKIKSSEFKENPSILDEERIIWKD